MTNIITNNDETLKSFQDFINKRKLFQISSQSNEPFLITLVWKDIAGNRLYFKYQDKKFFWCFNKYTLETIAQKLHEKGVLQFIIDTSHILYTDSFKNNISKRVYKK